MRTHVSMAAIDEREAFGNIVAMSDIMNSVAISNKEKEMNYL